MLNLCKAHKLTDAMHRPSSHSEQCISGEMLQNQQWKPEPEETEQLLDTFQRGHFSVHSETHTWGKCN